MKVATYNKFRTLLTKAIDRHIKKGGKLIYGAFSGGKTNNYCPITCVLNGNDTDPFERLNKKLGDQVVATDYWNFIDGFDGNTVQPERTKTRLFKLGQQLRQKYSPEKV